MITNIPSPSERGEQKKVFEPWLPSAATTPEEQVATDPVETGHRSSRPRPGFILGPVAFVTSLVGTLLLGSPENGKLGQLLLVVAAIISLVAWGGQRWVPAFGPMRTKRSLLVWDTQRALRFGNIGVAAMLVLVANMLFPEQPQEAFGLIGWLWLASMALLIFATAGWPRETTSSEEGEREDKAGQGAQTSVTTTLPVRASRKPVTLVGSTPQRWAIWEVALFAGIVLVGLAMRVWDLQSWPFHIHPDEIITARVARDAYMGPNPASIFITLWPNIDLPALWFVLVAASLNLGDSTLAAARLPTALIGAATTIPVYLFVRDSWGRVAAIVAGATFAFGVASVHYSRVTINNMTSALFWAACFYFLMRGLRLKRPLDWVLAGLAGGLGEHFYYGTRLLPMLLVGFGIYLLVFHWKRARYYLALLPLTAIAYLAAMGPLLTFFFRHPELYLGRKPGARPLNWSHIPTSWEDFQLMVDTLWGIMASNLLAISTQVSTDTFYFGPMLMVAEAALLVLGTALLVWRWRHPASFLVLSSTLGVLFVGGTLVPFPQNLNHWTPAFPGFYVAVAIPIGAWFATSAGMPKKVRNASAAIVGAGVVVLGLINYDYYWHRYYAVRPEADLLPAQARLQASLGVDYMVRNVGRTWRLMDQELSSYMVKGQDAAQIWNPMTELPMGKVADKGVAFIFINDNLQYYPLVKSLYPGGTERVVNNRDGIYLLTGYWLTPEQTRALYGVNATVFNPSGDNAQWQGHVPEIGALPADISYPARVRWSGKLYLPETASYSLQVAGEGARLYSFDAQPPGPPEELRLLEQGWHSFVIEATLVGPTEVALWVAAEGQQPVEPTQMDLWPERAGEGLLRLSYGPEGATPYRTDMGIGFTAVNDPRTFGPSQFFGQVLTNTWVGQIEIPRQTTYTLEVVTDGRARLWVDGETALTTCRNIQSPEPGDEAVQLLLGPGWHDIRLDYIGGPEEWTRLELYWSSDEIERGLVPSSALRYSTNNGLAPENLPTGPPVIECPPATTGSAPIP
ncbi:MAG: glycosyltransferase family 39 protein [Chloroflexota bacterium]|nr:glycosyltransferase family 39 protein [Chloroflexota bacterium]MDQ5865521.1 glycosyltransferase family 39 protein [Chloroflexota bacterium]